MPAFRPEPGFWGTKNFWAPEAHAYRGRYFLFTSFIAEKERRGTQVLAADAPTGPYRVHSPGPLTPRDLECLDGTLHVEEDGSPWLVFCHEWVQVRDGEVRAVRLEEDLSRPAGNSRLLFRASEAPWTRPVSYRGAPPDPASRVTDGPFLHRAADGTLLMLWSSFCDTGYAFGHPRRTVAPVRRTARGQRRRARHGLPHVRGTPDGHGAHAEPDTRRAAGVLRGRGARRNAGAHGSNTFPGLRMPTGSSARLIARIAATAPSPTLRASRSFFTSPMPCSPETTPPRAIASS